MSDPVRDRRPSPPDNKGKLRMPNLAHRMKDPRLTSMRRGLARLDHEIALTEHRATQGEHKTRWKDAAALIESLAKEMERGKDHIDGAKDSRGKVIEKPTPRRDLITGIVAQLQQMHRAEMDVYARKEEIIELYMKRRAIADTEQKYERNEREYIKLDELGFVMDRMVEVIKGHLETKICIQIVQELHESVFKSDRLAIAAPSAPSVADPHYTGEPTENDSSAGEEPPDYETIEEEK